MTAPWPGIPEARRHHEPRRDSEVAAWLRRHRDRHDFTAGEGVNAYQALDDVLDDYRLHADTGTPLDEDSETGSYGGQCGCGVRADDSPVPGLRDRTAGQLGLCGEDPGAMRSGPAGVPTDGEYKHDDCATCGTKAPAAGVAASDEPALYELQVPTPPPAHVAAVQPTSHSDGPWRRDGDEWVRGRQRCTWDELMWKYNSRGRGVEPVQAARSAAHPDNGEQHG